MLFAQQLEDTNKSAESVCFRSQPLEISEKSLLEREF